VNNIQYTAQFGNGVSGTIGLDDPTVFNRTVVANLTIPLTATGAIANAYAGTHAPGRRRQHPHRSGLGYVPGVGRGSRGQRFVQRPETRAGSAGATGLAGAAPTALSEISGHPDTKWAVR